jgi:hypothetical protein
VAWGNISDGAAGGAHETAGVQVYAPMVSNGNVAVDGGTGDLSHEALTVDVGADAASVLSCPAAEGVNGWVFGQRTWRGGMGEECWGADNHFCIYCMH